MRKVFRNSEECIHIWASRSQDEGRSANTFFEGDTLYSYGHHFPLAKFVKSKQGAVAVLLNAGSYSVTTSRQQSATRHAVNHLTSFTVAQETIERWTGGSKDVLDAAMNAWATDADEILLKASRARRNAPLLFGSAQETVNIANRFAEFFGLRRRLTLPADFAEATAAAQARMDKASAKEKRERARQIAAAAKESAERMVRVAADLEQWKQGADTAHKYGWSDLPCALRIDPATMTIETSHGARVPVSVAPGLWRLVEHCRKTARPFDTTEAVRAGDYMADQKFAIGPYQLSRIDAQGSVTIGCHQIAHAELARIAGLLGLA
jgi:hypothetical protein